jgi:hypothetical protein
MTQHEAMRRLWKLRWPSGAALGLLVLFSVQPDIPIR